MFMYIHKIHHAKHFKFSIFEEYCSTLYSEVLTISERIGAMVLLHKLSLRNSLAHA